jgi:hypothetical protein
MPGSNYTMVGSAEKTTTATATENPASFASTTTTPWVAFTIAIAPAAASGPSYVYKGPSTWTTHYKGIKTDAQLYKGINTLHL